MQTDVANEILDVLKVLPESKQRQILKQAKDLVKEESKLTIWQKIRAHAAEIPKEELDRMPTDASENLDHYLYGSPKK